MEHTKQNVDVDEKATDKMGCSQSDSMNNREWDSYDIVLRLFFISVICEQTDALVSFKNVLVRKDASNKYYPILEQKELWPNIANGLQIFMNDLIQNGAKQRETEILISAFADFARPWSSDTNFKLQMKRFISLAKKDIDFSTRNDTDDDFYTFVLHLYVDTKIDHFHSQVENALTLSSSENWEPLQKTLNNFLIDLLFDMKYVDPITNIETCLRLIRCFRTNRDALVAKAGMAYHSLLNILKGPNAIFITQKVTEEE